LLIANAKTFNDETTHYWRLADELQAVVKRLRKVFVDVAASRDGTVGEAALDNPSALSGKGRKRRATVALMADDDE
jgi:hypothetical protein